MRIKIRCDIMKVKTKDGTKDMRAVWMEDEKVCMIDQRFLPRELRFFTANDHYEIRDAIKKMMIRGAPSIGVTAAYGMAQAAINGVNINEASKVIKSARPTAYDLFYAVDHMVNNMNKDPVSMAEKYADSVVDKCKAIGEHGTSLISNDTKVLTHCNAGALATVDHGTALAPIRAAHDAGRNVFVFVDETRPRLQGMRLTAWELENEGISHAIIVDNAAGHFIQRGEVDMVIVGTDRIAANGDIANKIGTYEKAVVAKENGVPFYVAAPVTTFDPTTPTGMDIPIEERDHLEVLDLEGSRIHPEGSSAMNPAFDVTPAHYITGFITEKGVYSPSELENMF